MLPEFSSVLSFCFNAIRERNAFTSINRENMNMRPQRNLGNSEDSAGYEKLFKRRSKEITVIVKAKNNSFDVFFIEIKFTPDLDPPLKSGGSHYLYKPIN